MSSFFFPSSFLLITPIDRQSINHCGILDRHVASFRSGKARLTCSLPRTLSLDRDRIAPFYRLDIRGSGWDVKCAFCAPCSCHTALIGDLSLESESLINANGDLEESNLAKWGVYVQLESGWYMKMLVNSCYLTKNNSVYFVWWLVSMAAAVDSRYYLDTVHWQKNARGIGVLTILSSLKSECIIIWSYTILFSCAILSYECVQK